MNPTSRTVLLTCGLITMTIAAPGLASSNRHARVHGKALAGPIESKLGKVAPKIIGGGPAGQGQNRWITSLQYQGEHFCGGALVADDWILTAAHCVIDESASDPGLSVWVGGHDQRQAGQGVRRDVTRIVLHPQYDDFTTVNDIALLQLSAAVPGDIPRVQLANTQIMSTAAAPNQPATISGWGVLAENGDLPNLLHEVVVPIVSNATCNAPQSYGGEIGAKQICAGLRSGGKDSCQGDSGGPLWAHVFGRDYHLGIVSFGDGCALPDKYGVYTRTASYQQWVVQNTGAGSGNDPGNTPGTGGGNPDPGDSGGNQNDPGQCSLPPTEQPTGPIMLVDGATKSNLSAQRDHQLEFTIQVPAGARRLIIDSWDGQGDADLYVAFGRQPDTEDYDFSPYMEGNEERVTVQQPQAGSWYITLVAYEAFSNVKLRAIIR